MMEDKQKQTIELVELAGYQIKKNTSTFSLWDGEIKLYGYSSYSLLTPSFMMKQIKEISFNRGFKRGEKNLKQAIKDLITI